MRALSLLLLIAIACCLAVPSGIDAGKDFHKVHVTITDNPNQDKRASITRVAYRTKN